MKIINTPATALKFKLEGYRAPLSDCFTPDELSGLFRFYVLQAPIAKDKTALSTQRTLTSLGWNGPSIKILERKLLKASGITSFIFIGSQTIDGTLENMALDKEICVEHPRAVLHKDVKLTLERTTPSSAAAVMKTECSASFAIYEMGLHTDRRICFQPVWC